MVRLCQLANCNNSHSINVCLIDFIFIGYFLNLFVDKSIWLKVFVVCFFRHGCTFHIVIFRIERSSSRRGSIKKGVVKNSAHFTGKDRF